MSISYDYYRIFYHVAKYHSFTRAAEVLMSNQPNITRTMNHLEHELGCRLFLRTNRGITLTPDGERLYDRVKIAQEQIQAGEQELASHKALESGNLVLGASEAALHGLLLPVLSRFRREHPGVRIRLINQTTPQAVAALKNGAVELALVTTPSECKKPLREIRLREHRDILVALPQEAALYPHPLSCEELSGHPLISLGQGTASYELYSRSFAQKGLSFEPDIQAATADQILPLVRHGLGWGLLPDFLARQAIQQGEVVQLELREELPRRYICLLRDTTRPLSLAAQELERMLYQDV